MTGVVDGILAVNKPPDISSAAVVGRIKRHKGVQKVGHTGTLDPFATGVLLCGINRGTRISRFLLGGEKHYRATLALGVETDTLDARGTVTAEASPDQVHAIDPGRIPEMAAQFQGPQKQVPPVYSALKHQGVPLYRLARQGRPVEKPPRDIEIYSIQVVSVALPRVILDVHCSAGTYIRSLARDMGAALGCGAHLAALCRTAACGIALEHTVSLDQVKEMDTAALNRRIIPMARALDHLPGLTVNDAVMARIRFGQPLHHLLPPPAPTGEGEEGNDAGTFVRLLDAQGRLAAVVAYDPHGAQYNYCCVFAD